MPAPRCCRGQEPSSHDPGVVDAGAQVLLLPRPRRFGKTLNLSTLRYFFERSHEDRSDLFCGLAAWSAGQTCRSHFQRHPVIYLTFKDLKASTFQGFASGLATQLKRLFKEHRELLDPPLLTRDERSFFGDVMSGRASPQELQGVLYDLSSWLHDSTGEDVVILVDEYDTPIHAGYAHGYYQEVVEFFRVFLSGGLKDNPYLFKGVLTGILRVAKESIFSGLNNLAVHTIVSHRFSGHFGFTRSEVESLAREAGAQDRLGEIREWYDGYLFGGRVVYNPWSVLCYMDNPQDGPKPYWVSTASDELLRGLLLGRGAVTHDEMQVLLGGGSLTRPVQEHVALRDLDLDRSAVWSFLLFSGYLKGEGPHGVDNLDNPLYRLSVPNREVYVAYRGLYLSWLRNGLGGQDRLDALGRALLSGDAEGFRAHLELLLRHGMSYHDLGGAEPERVYQAFIMGLSVHLEQTHMVRSNRESGLGRYDVSLIPRQAGRDLARRSVRGRNGFRSAFPLRRNAKVKRPGAETVSDLRFLSDETQK